MNHHLCISIAYLYLIVLSLKLILEVIFMQVKSNFPLFTAKVIRMDDARLSHKCTIDGRTKLSGGQGNNGFKAKAADVNCHNADNVSITVNH